MDGEAREAAGADSSGMKDGKLVKGGTCIDMKAFFISAAAVSIFLDVWLLYIPSAIVWGINMPRRQKFMVVCVLSIGVMVTGLSIARLIVVPGNYDLSHEERTYSIKYTLSNIEANCAIWAAAIPALKSLITRISPRWWQTAKAVEPYPNSLKQPHVSGLPPLVGGEKVSRNASSSDAQSYPVGFSSPLRRANNSEVELRRFEHDARVSSLFRHGRNYIPDDCSSEGALSVLAGSSNRQPSQDPKMAPGNGNPFDLERGK
ncbi:hypothetical protein AJ78_02564 [Emergomyces pasteurianus Ep9510]|uniref:Rhodopsin domain-containing protein n=1 Tax=Emergomyces pasteurianus Ep9510 TaxID=1447872 RepID=A0A1J9PMJ1_9EURO|nr:hypothetical protein AJ78_02564 [Emergomyces pasteurianus Ep9510]